MTDFNGFNGQAEPNSGIVPMRTTEKEEEYLLTFTFENLGQAMQQASDDSFTSRLIGHTPGAELIEIAMTFHNKAQSGVFVPLDGHLNMVGTLNLGSNGLAAVGTVTGVTDVTMSGDLTGVDQVFATDGAAGTPPYSWQTSPTTGHFLPAANQVGLSIAGTENFRWTGTGFGIGVDPSYPLHMEVTGLEAIYIERTTAGNLQGIQLDASNDTIILFKESGTTRYHVGRDDGDNTFHIGTGATPGLNSAVAVTSNLDVGIQTASPASDLEVGGSLGHLSTTITSTPYTAADETVILVDTDTIGSAATVNLPAASGVTDRTYYIKNLGSFSVTVDGDASETIDGTTTVALSSQYDAIQIQCDGTSWHVIAANP